MQSAVSSRNSETRTKTKVHQEKVGEGMAMSHERRSDVPVDVGLGGEVLLELGGGRERHVDDVE